MSEFASLLSGDVKCFSGGAQIISQNDDLTKINWARGLADPGEMLRCGYLPEARRRNGESDEQYQARLIAMDLPKLLGAETFGKILAAAQRRAGLAVKDGQVCMFAALVPGWHDLGTVISQAANSEEALRFAKLAGWDLKKVEQLVEINGLLKPTGSYAVVRGDTGDILTYGKSVGSRYQVVGNEELFDFMDQVVDGTSTRYETAGALGSGEKVWLLAKMPRATVEVAPGDEVEAYLLLTASHDGSGAIVCFETSNRVVCANTYRNALRGRNGAGIAIRHTTNVKQKVEDARKALGLAQQAANDFADVARVLGRKPLEPGEYFKHMLDLAVGGELQIGKETVEVTGDILDSGELARRIAGIADIEEKAVAEVQVDRIKKVRDTWMEEVLAKYENPRNNGMESIRGTAWAAVNAVTEATQHGDLLRYKGAPRVRQESRFESLVDGRLAEISDSAVQLAMSM